jgi:hypothetical protein
MAAHNPTIRRLAATKAAELRHHGQPSASTANALAEAQIADYIERTVAGMPSLSPEACARLAVKLLLREPAA